MRRVVELDRRLDQRRAVGGGLRRRSSSGIGSCENFAPSVSSCQTIACIADQIDHAGEARSSVPIGSCTTTGVALRRFLIIDRSVEVGAHAVDLVDEADTRHVVLVRLAPHCLRLRLDAGDGVEHHDRAVEHAQRALDLDREVDVAGRVDDVDAVVVPGQVVAAAVIVMPRSRSCSIQSMVAVPSWTSPILWCRCSRGCARSSWSYPRRCAP